MGKAGFVWKGGTLEANVKSGRERTEKAIVAAVEAGSTFGENFARKNAPWTDRTSNARTTLFTTTEHEPYKRHRIIVAHGQPYGIWLEVRWAGRYRVIVPTIEATGRKTMTLLTGLMTRLGK